MKFYCNILLTALLCVNFFASCRVQEQPQTIHHHTDTVVMMESEPIYAPAIPSEIFFANDTVDLSRYDRRERMDRELLSFCYGHTNTLLMIKRANRYFPVVEPILKENGIPDDFKYLMAIESFNNPLAHSSAGAAGLWQFMTATGKEFGLEINNQVDERYNVEKSTEAACKYLKAAYRKTGDWISVAASYNAGQGRICGELRKQKEESAIDLWLNTETSRYMFRILAAKMVLEAPRIYGFNLTAQQLYPPLHYQEIQVDTTIDSLVNFAKEHHITYYDLKTANPWLRDRYLPNKSKKKYIILIPTSDSLHYNPDGIEPHHDQWVVKPQKK